MKSCFNLDMKKKKINQTIILSIILFFIVLSIPKVNSEEFDFPIDKVIPSESSDKVFTFEVIQDEAYLKFKSNGKSITINNLKKGSKILIKEGKIISAEIIKTIDEPAEINGQEIKLLKDKKIVYSEGKITEGEFEIIKKDTYIIGNRKIELPEGTKVTIERGIAKILLPAGSRISKPVKADANKPDELTYEFTTTAGSSITFDGRKLTSVKKDSIPLLYFDNQFEGFYIESEANVDNIDIGTIGIVKKLYFFDKKTPEGFNSAAMVYDGDKLSIIASPGVNSPSIWFKSGNKFIDIKEDQKFVIQARGGMFDKDLKLLYSEKSRIDIIKKSGEIAGIDSFGFYTMINGNNLIQYDKNKKSPRIARILNSNDKSLVVRIHSLNSEGKIIEYTGDFKTADGKIITKNLKVDWDLFMDDKNGFVVARNKDIEVRSKLNFYTLNQENLEKLRTLTIDQQIQILSDTNTNLLSVLSKIELSKINENIRFGKHQVTKSYQATYRSKMMNDIMSHEDPEDDNEQFNNDLVTKAHETTHGINAYIRNNYGTGTSKQNGFYLGDGKYQLLTEPRGVTLADVSGRVPSELVNSGSYNTYLIEQQAYWNNEPLYILDEMTCYTNGAIVAVETGSRNSLNLPEFMTYALALGRTIEQKNPKYYNSKYGEEFRNFLGYSLRRTMDAHIRQTTRASANGRGLTRNDAIKRFISTTNSDLQNYAIRTFGKHWTNEILGF